MRSAKVQENPEQKLQRLRAERDNISAIQKQASDRTMMFQRIMSPRLSIATGRSAFGSLPLR